MTFSPDPLDELASAYLDDELSPSERLDVEADPVAMARVQEFEAIHSAVASPVPTAEREVRLNSVMAAMGTPVAALAAVEQAEAGRYIHSNYLIYL